MKPKWLTVDRGLLIVLAMVVLWLAFPAHGDRHMCEFDWEVGYGSVDSSGTVEIYDGGGTVDCYHY